MVWGATVKRQTHSKNCNVAILRGVPKSKQELAREGDPAKVRGVAAENVISRGEMKAQDQSNTSVYRSAMYLSVSCVSSRSTPLDTWTLELAWSGGREQSTPAIVRAQPRRGCSGD